MKRLKAISILGLVVGLVLSVFLYTKDESSLSSSNSVAGSVSVLHRQEPTIREAEISNAEPRLESQLYGQETTSSESPITQSTPSGIQGVDNSEIEPEERSINQFEESGNLSADENEVDAPRLSQRVVNVISEVQTRQLDGQWEEALNEMNALYTEFDELTPFEQTTLLNFYTNTLLQLEMWQESISAFSLMLTIPGLRPDVNGRALIALGQLHNRVGESEAAISYYEGWFEFTDGMENMEEQTQRVRQLLVQASETASN